MQKRFWIILLGLGLVFWGFSQIYSHKEESPAGERDYTVAVQDTDTTYLDTTWVDSLEVDTTDTTFWW